MCASAGMRSEYCPSTFVMTLCPVFPFTEMAAPMRGCKGKCKSQSKEGNGVLNNVMSCIRMIHVDKEKAGLDK